MNNEKKKNEKKSKECVWTMLEPLREPFDAAAAAEFSHSVTVSLPSL